MVLLYVALGGAAGALARYGLSGWVHARAGFSFPWGTLAVNVLGCFLIGLSVRYLEAARPLPEHRALVTIGLLGAFTTFSTFSYETVALLEDGDWPSAVAYLLGSVLLGLLAVYAGLAATGWALISRG